MINIGGLLTAGIAATAIPTLLGTLMAYCIISIVLGPLLWAGKSIPDEVGIAITGSGLFILAVLIVGFVIAASAFS